MDINAVSKLGIAILYRVAQAAFSAAARGGLFQRVYVLVEMLMDEDIDGDTKKQRVRDAMAGAYPQAKTWLVDTLIQISLAYLRTRVS